jgi:hypothetical protein
MKYEPIQYVPVHNCTEMFQTDMNIIHQEWPFRVVTSI